MRGWFPGALFLGIVTTPLLGVAGLACTPDDSGGLGVFGDRPVETFDAGGAKSDASDARQDRAADAQDAASEEAAFPPQDAADDG